MSIYLDHNATTPVRAEVFEGVVAFLRDEFGNASSVHAPGSRARCAVEDARVEVAAALGAASAEIVFTGGGTESNNLAITGAARAANPPRVLIGAIEHSSVLAPADRLRAEGRDVCHIPTDPLGKVDVDALSALLDSAGALVSIGWANNEIGTIQAIEQIAALCRERRALLHVDAVQAVGKVPVRVAGIDFLSLSAHKLGGLKGCGALYVRKGLRLEPMIVGGGQERGLRAGTENVAAIVGLGLACRLAIAETAWFGEASVGLRDRLWKELRARIAGMHRNGPADGLPNTLNVRFEGVRGEALVAALDLEGVAVSSGSACAAGAGEPSHVLRALGLDEEDARDGVRFSLGRTNTPEEIDQAVEITVAAVARIRSAHGA
jgi:cysteine desulfurase